MSFSNLNSTNSAFNELCFYRRISETSTYLALYINKNFVKFKIFMKSFFQIYFLVTTKVGVYAKPETVHVISALPKNSSGKILRRYLKKVCHGDLDFGDTSIMLDNLTVLDELKLIKH